MALTFGTLTGVTRPFTKFITIWIQLGKYKLTTKCKINPPAHLNPPSPRGVFKREFPDVLHEPFSLASAASPPRGQCFSDIRRRQSELSIDGDENRDKTRRPAPRTLPKSHMPLGRGVSSRDILEGNRVK